MTKTRFLTLVMALALLLAIPTAVFAQRVPPHVFVGTASLNGVAAADGSAVTAWVDGEMVADAYASGGDYTLLVDQGDSSFSGKAVSFKISGVDAAETAEWIQGGAEVLDLVAAAGSTAAGSGATGKDGASGAKGAKGDTGAAGPAGSVGAAGAAGSDGAAGAAGATGPAGSAGSAGAAGAAGADGADGGGGLGVIALIVAIVALLAAGGSYMMGRRA
jgi:pilus assembly protein FimV